MKKIIFAVLFVVLVCSLSFAADQVTLTTYYPAPFGMYQEMRVMGKLGVGTQDPKANLDVVGNIIVDGGNGDINKDGQTNSTDAAQVLSYVMTGVPALTREMRAIADVDGDGVLTREDAKMIQYMFVNGVGSKETIKRQIHSIAYKMTDGSSNRYFMVDGFVGIGLNPFSESAAYPLQVGVPAGAAPSPTIGAAIKNDLWVDGNVYSNNSGAWSRDAGNGWLYPLTLTDSVGIGTNTLAAGTKLHVSSADTGVRITDTKAANYAFSQDASGAYNYFNGNVGIGAAPTAQRLFIAKADAGAETVNDVLLQVGGNPDAGRPVSKITANAVIYGTLGVSSTAGFGGAIRAYKGIQLGRTTVACSNSLTGTLQYITKPMPNPTQACLQICTGDGASGYIWRDLGGCWNLGTQTDPPIIVPPPATALPDFTL